MTHKEHCIYNLHKARTTHIRWINTIKLLVSGIDIDSSQIVLEPIKSDFGEWFYNEASYFSFGTSRLVLEEIEKKFLSCHDLYTKIYLIFFANKSKTILGELFGLKSTISSHEKELAGRYYEELVLMSDQLKSKMRTFEAQLISQSDEKFATYGLMFNEKNTITKETVVKKEAEEATEGKAYFYGARGRG